MRQAQRGNEDQPVMDASGGDENNEPHNHEDDGSDREVDPADGCARRDVKPDVIVLVGIEPAEEVGHATSELPATRDCHAGIVFRCSTPDRIRQSGCGAFVRWRRGD
jgi:hypothetical protein